MSKSKRNNARCLKSNDFMLFARKRRLDRQARDRRITRAEAARKVTGNQK